MKIRGAARGEQQRVGEQKEDDCLPGHFHFSIISPLDLIAQKTNYDLSLTTL